MDAKAYNIQYHIRMNISTFYDIANIVIFTNLFLLNGTKETLMLLRKSVPTPPQSVTQGRILMWGFGKIVDKLPRYLHVSYAL